jgi:hypothetical protein
MFHHHLSIDAFALIFDELEDVAHHCDFGPHTITGTHPEIGVGVLCLDSTKSSALLVCEHERPQFADEARP